MPDNKVPLKDLFMHLQKQMAAILNTNRDCIPHQGVKGDACEDCWRKMLRKYLPKRYQVEKAFVVDSKDQCSDQIDIVIFDQQYSHFMFNQNDTFYVPAESVYAVIEAKQDIDKGVIEYAAEKAASVRKLHRTNALFNTATGIVKKHSMFEIPAGVVGLGTGWNPPLGEAFEKIIEAKAKIDGQRIDFGCALEGGAFNIKYIDPKVPTIEKSGSEIALVSFLWQLVARLQQQGTAPAVDVAEYFKAL
jgi:hypothetical protein